MSIIDDIKDFARWHHLNETTVAAGRTPSDSEIDFEVEAWLKIEKALASPTSSNLAGSMAIVEICRAIEPDYDRLFSDEEAERYGSANITKEDVQQKAERVVKALDDRFTVIPQPWKGRETFAFELGTDEIERLAALAERCDTQGIGILASAEYHGQGLVQVPSKWLRQLIAGYSEPNGRQKEKLHSPGTE